MMVVLGVLSALAAQRFVKAIQVKDDAGRDHCEKLICILAVAWTVAVAAL
jgi:hypothetical protein